MEEVFLKNHENKLNLILSQAVEELEIFVKLASSQTQVSFLEFRADLEEIYSVLLRLWHELDLQSSFSKKRQKKYSLLRQAILESLVECSCRKEQSTGDWLPEWEQITQEESLRKDVVNIFGELIGKLRDAQLELDISLTSRVASFFSFAEEE